MAKQTLVKAVDLEKFASERPSLLTDSKVPAVIAVILLGGYVGVAYYWAGLPIIWQRLAGIVCALLAVATYGLATRQIIPREELLSRLAAGAGAEEIQRATHPPRRSVRLPLVGDVTLRFLGGIAVFVLVAGWWFTPLAPIKVIRPVIKDLTIPFAQEIAGASLAFPAETMATPLPPVIPFQAPMLARRINKDRADSYLLGLRAIAEGRFGEARTLLADAERGRVAQPAQIQLARAQNEMFASRFADAAEQYAEILQAKPNDPMLLCQAAVARIQAGQYPEAKLLVERIAKLAEEGLAKNSPEWGVCLHVQAVFNAVVGMERDKGEKMCFDARNIFETPLGPKHPLMAASLNNQAVLYAIRANYAGAEQLDKNARDIWSESYDPKHPLVADSCYNLAMIHFAQGRYADARQAIDKSLAICRENLPRGHLTLAVIQHGQAVVQLAMGQYAEAQATGERSLALFEKILGINNPNLIPVVTTLGAIYAERALYIKAENHYLRALRMGKEAWGPKHPCLIPPLCRLARLYLDLGRSDEAKTACAEALEITEETLDDEHPAMAAVLNLRAVIEIRTGDPRDAREDLERTLEIREEKLGKDHPDVIRTHADLAALNNSPHTFGRGVTEYKKAIEQLEKHLGKKGEKHPEIADLLFCVARLHFRQDEYAEADSCLKQVQAIQEETLSMQKKNLLEYHPKLAKTLDARAAVLAKTAPDNVDGIAALRNRANAIRAEHAKINKPPEEQQQPPTKPPPVVAPA